VYLKSLTLRGFKSFASATTLRFEPGITAVVGPNGSGKSNVVDALAWVMGEQGAKTLRGGRMDDVIFAGAGGAGGPGRAALGRAEVVLTIDNSDGALPIDYTEVSITRTMFRQGGSDYAINGSSCRLLDIQELLSDSGIGREMHVIVGQGRLDAVLAAGPEERRAFVEEAAGVLKHRRRKEKALRKLDAMAANLTRVADLTTELRRQLKPLGRQAETARRAQAIAAELREVRGRLLAADHARVAATLDDASSGHRELEARRAILVEQIAVERAERDALEIRAGGAGDLIAAAQQEWFATSALLERLAGTLALARERARTGSGGPEVELGGPDPVQLQAEAVRLRAAEAERLADVDHTRATVAVAAQARAAAQQSLARAEQRRAEIARAQVRLRDRVATLSGELAAARSRRAARAAEIERTRAAVAEAAGRAEKAEREFTAREHGVAGLDAGESDLDVDHEKAEAAHDAAAAELDRLREATRAVENARSSSVARRDALQLALGARDAAAALLQAGLAAGTVAESIIVDGGWEAAVAAALGRWADAVVVDGAGGVRAALKALAGSDGGQAALLVAGAAPAPDSGDSDPALTSAPGTPGVPLAGLVRVRPDAAAIGPALRAALSGLVGVGDLDEAAAVVAAGQADGRSVTAVTRDGELVGPLLAAGGRTGRSRVELATAVAEATATIDRLTHDAQRLRFDLATATGTERTTRAAVEQSLERLHDSDARLAAVAEELGHLGQAARAARAEGQRLQQAADAAERALLADDADVANREQRLAAARAEALEVPGTLFEQDVDVDDADADAQGAGPQGAGPHGAGPHGAGPADQPAPAVAAAQLEVARAAEVDARLALRGAEERLAAVAGRADALERQARAREVAVLRARRAAQERLRMAARASAVATGAAWLADLVGAQALVATERVTVARAAAAGSVAEVRALRERLAATENELIAVTEDAHATGMSSAGLRAELDRIEVQAAEQLAVTPAELAAEFGPGAPVPEGLELPADRAGLESRRRAAERALTELGRVNPLALEEFDALRERLDFLTVQLRDLEASRDDLLGVVAEVDDRVRQVFAAAFADTATAFEGVFARLFPGGEGRLVLTDPDDPLLSGIEIEARPAGKKVARLSLLSGGERSLVAVALLVSIFKARPSPFYVLDEVEAALDDTNLGRLLSIYEELRENSQLIVVTHQKRTMEIADALYGVSMRGDGVTTVISQRVRDREPVPA
jgi:chromosome segregation protein